MIHRTKKPMTGVRHAVVRHIFQIPAFFETSLEDILSIHANRISGLPNFGLF
jgi:hypothetical protein